MVKKIGLFLIMVMTTLIIPTKAKAVSSDYIYLSDIDYEAESSVGWGSIQIDKNVEGGTISLKYGDEVLSFDKGMGAHAKSNLIYDVSSYSDIYTRLSSYIGVDYSKGSGGNGVKFYIYISQNKTNWDLVYESGILKGNSNSEYVNIDITGAKYIKLYANDNGANGYDHAVYGDLRLLKTDYDINSEYVSEIKSLDEYDSLIRSLNTNNTMTDEIRNLVLERTFVSRFGYQTLQQFAKKSNINKESLEYIFNNPEVLNYFVTGGTIDRGTYTGVLNAWASLYAKYKSDWVNYKTDANSLMYLKMTISLALVNSRGIYFWTGGKYASNPVERYAVYKYLIDTGRFNINGIWSTEKFASLPIESMRWVVNVMMNDDEIVWLNDYSKSKTSNFLNAYSFIIYTSGYNYNKADYYDASLYEKWNNLYNLDNIKFPDGITDRTRVFEYGTTGAHRLWMVFNSGSVCGGLAKTYANLAQVFGMPAAVIGQPGHAAAVRLSYDSNGNGVWALLNDVSGWAQSEKSERLPLAWGSTNWDSYYQVSYLLLSQNALNNNEALERAQYYNYLASIYSTNPEMQISLYNKAIEEQSTNFDAFVGLIAAYKSDATKTSADYLNLARRIINTYTYYPVPMVDLLSLIKSKITDDADIISFDLLKTNALNAAAKATSNDVLQPSPTQQVAKSLLNAHTTALATFSFDGENAGKIILNEKYNTSEIRVKYTLGGMLTDGENDVTQYIETDSHVITLTQEQIDSITAENDIVVGIVGSNDLYVIDIKNTAAPTGTTLYPNDLENKFIGNTANLEISLDGGNTWCDYTDETRIIGDVRSIVRYKKHDVYLASDTSIFTFHQNTDTDYEKYITIDNISLYKFSTQNSTNTSHAAKNIIDGSGNTAWHTAFGGDSNKFISVKFNTLKYISAIDYVPAAQNGRFKSGEIYSSLDGENWILVKTFQNLANNTNTKNIKLDEPVLARYIKVAITGSYGNTSGEVNKYASGKMLNFYEDITKIVDTEATVSYNIDKLTNKDVEATITLPSGASSEQPLTYVFMDNGTINFNYQTIDREEKTLEINVSWIDKKAPTAEVEYIEENNVVKAVLKNISEEVTVKNTPNGETYYFFTKNETFIFELEDKAGNIGQVEAVVNSIKEDDPIDNLPIVETIGKLEYNLNDSIDLYSLIKVIDSEDGEIVVNDSTTSIETNLDASKAGVYDVVYTVVDSKGNIAVHTLNLTIKTIAEQETPNIPDELEKPNVPEELVKPTNPDKEENYNSELDLKPSQGSTNNQDENDDKEEIKDNEPNHSTDKEEIKLGENNEDNAEEIVVGEKKSNHLNIIVLVSIALVLALSIISFLAFGRRGK